MKRRRFFLADGREFRMPEANKFNILPTDFVLDLGAHHGFFALLMLDKGASSVRSVEMVPTNCEKYIVNMEREYSGRYELVRAAVVPDNFQGDSIAVHDRQPTSFYDDMAGSVAPYTRRYLPSKYSVPVVRIGSLMPGVTIAKVDIEGAEYGLGFERHLSGVRALVIEFHGVRDSVRRAAAYRIMEDVEVQGFHPLIRPGFRTQFDCDGVWER